MKTSCVLDASIVARWFLVADPRPLDHTAGQFLRLYCAGDLDIHEPDLLLSEVGNALWKAVRLGGWPPAEAELAIRDLLDLRLAIHPAESLLGDAFALAIAHGSSVYDAIYVALARHLGVPLYTADRRLAARLAGAFDGICLVGATGDRCRET